MSNESPPTNFSLTSFVDDVYVTGCKQIIPQRGTLKNTINEN
jgi:hypothetical protein